MYCYRHVPVQFDPVPVESGSFLVEDRSNPVRPLKNPIWFDPVQIPTQSGPIRFMSIGFKSMSNPVQSGSTQSGPIQFNPIWSNLFRANGCIGIQLGGLPPPQTPPQRWGG